MGKVKHLVVALAAAACVAGAYRVRAQAAGAGQTAVNQSESLFAQSAAEILDREYPGDELSYLLLDARTGLLLASHWPDVQQAIPMGSLVKPFTALAYAQHHEFHYPTYECHGRTGGCWNPHPHGRLNLTSALAFSCNSYFRELAAGVTAGDLQELSAQLAFDPPDSKLRGPELMGIGDEWPISPMHMARAYLELIRRRDSPGVREILAGLEDSAQWGTGSGAGRALVRGGALVKTGTSVCRHPHRGPGDGFAIVLWPADAPDLLLMLRVHSAPGATAASTAGRMLARLEP